MTFANKYTEQHYILSDDHRKQVVLSDTREPRKYIANNTKHQRVIVYKVDGGIISDKAQRKCDYAFWTDYLRVGLLGQQVPMPMRQNCTNSLRNLAET